MEFHCQHIDFQTFIFPSFQKFSRRFRNFPVVSEIFPSFQKFSRRFRIFFPFVSEIFPSFQDKKGDFIMHGDRLEREGGKIHRKDGCFFRNSRYSQFYFWNFYTKKISRRYRIKKIIDPILDFFSNLVQGLILITNATDRKYSCFPL